MATSAPAGRVSGDTLVLVTYLHPTVNDAGSIATPSGWTAVLATASSDDTGGYGTTGSQTGDMMLAVFTRTADGTATDTPTVTLTNNSTAAAQMYLVRHTSGVAGVVGNWAAWTTASSAHINPNFGSTHSFQDGDVGFFGFIGPTNIGTTQWRHHKLVQSGAVFATHWNDMVHSSSGGFGRCASVGWSHCVGGAGSGNLTGSIHTTTGSAATRGPCFYVRVRPNTPVAENHKALTSITDTTAWYHNSVSNSDTDGHQANSWKRPVVALGNGSADVGAMFYQNVVSDWRTSRITFDMLNTGSTNIDIGFVPTTYNQTASLVGAQFAAGSGFYGLRVDTAGNFLRAIANGSVDVSSTSYTPDGSSLEQWSIEFDDIGAGDWEIRVYRGLTLVRTLTAATAPTFSECKLVFLAYSTGTSGNQIGGNVTARLNLGIDVPVAVETEVALSLPWGAEPVPGVETETALPFTFESGISLSAPQDTDTALPITLGLSIGTATEADSIVTVTYPLVLALATAVVTVSAPTWSAPTISTGLSLLLSTAEALIAPGGGSGEIAVEFTSGPIALTLDDPAEILVRGGDVVMLEGVGWAVGDFRTWPVEITTSGTFGWDWYAYWYDDDDYIVPEWSPARSGESIWFRYAPQQAGELTFSATGGGIWQILSMTDENDASTWEVDWSGPVDGTPFTVNVSEPIYIRVESDGSAHPTPGVGIAGLSWSFAAVVGEASLTLRPALVYQTPSSVRATITGGPEATTVDFFLNATFRPTSPPLASEITDSTGQVIDVSIPLAAIPAGTHQIQAYVGLELLAATSFQVQLDPPDRPTTPVADLPPLEVVQTGVRKFVLQDPAPSGEEYVFPANPSEMDSPHVPMEVSASKTLAPNGQAIIWQGAPRAHEWTFSGYTTSQDFYEALERFRALRHRFYLMDHRNRAWVVSFTAIDWTPRRNIEHPQWSFDYKVSAVIYKGPVTPV
jgi:hypothetical protein